MQKEIEKELLRLKIKGKQIRKRLGLYISIISAFIVLLYVIPYFYLNPNPLLTLGQLVVIVGFFFLGIFVYLLFRPFEPEFEAFQKVAQAIEILEKSNEYIAYEEAYRHLEKAHKKLKGIKLRGDRIWYNETNETIKHFLENLELIVLPALSVSNMKTEHLEEIALAIISENPLRIKSINETLESEESYKKSKPSLRWTEIFKTRFREGKIFKLLYSLVLGYGLVLIISLVYVVLTEQDFMVFARENPEIVILGGLTVSGFTYWKSK